MFNPEEETTTAIAWISFPSLPPNFFGEDVVFSLAAAVEKPLQVDMATKNQTRPSCARVKVEVDLLREFPKRIKIEMKMKHEEVLERWIKIKYDYVPKYCQTCMIQGHNEEQYFVVHPELYPKEKAGQVDGKRTERKQINSKERKSEVNDAEKAGNNQKFIREEGFVEHRHKKWGGDKIKQPEQVWNRDGLITRNTFNMLAQDEQKGGGEGEKLDLNVVDTNGDTPGIQMSNNKEKSTKRQGGTRENDSMEGNSQAGIKNIETSGHTKNNHQASKKEGGRTERSIDKDGSTKENYEGKDQRTENKFNDSGSRNMLESCRKSGRSNFMEINDIEIRKSPNLIEEDDEVLQHIKDTEENEDIKYNIQQISKACDLSPRHTNSLKYGARKGKRTLPLQVQTRSSREKASNSDQ